MNCLDCGTEEKAQKMRVETRIGTQHIPVWTCPSCYPHRVYQ